MSCLLMSGVHMSCPEGTVLPHGQKYKQESGPLVTLLRDPRPNGNPSESGPQPGKLQSILHLVTITLCSREVIKHVTSSLYFHCI